MKKQLQKEDLTDPAKVDSLLNDNSMAQIMTDEYIEFGKGKRIGVKGRKMNDPKGSFTWDIAYRIPLTNPVSIIAKDENGEKYLFVIQLRPTLDGKKLVLSFPAGLIEADNTIAKLNQKIIERTKKRSLVLKKEIKPDLVPDQFKALESEPALLTALLELKEETGFFPISCKLISNPKNPMPKSAGLTNESDNVVECIVDSKSVSDPIPEKTEDIAIIWLTPMEFLALVEQLPSEKVVVENNAWMYMKGIMDGIHHANKKKAKKPN